MVRRILASVLGIGLGLGVGVPLAYRAHVGLTPTLALLVAMTVGACVLTFVRRPIWRHENAVESLLRIVLGLMMGALLELGARRFLDHTLPFALPPLGGGLMWLEHPALLGAFTGGVLGLLVGVEPTPAKLAAKSEAPKSERSTPSAGSSGSALADRGGSGTTGGQ